MDDNRLVVELEAEDNTGPGIQSANANLGKFEAQAAKSARNASSAFDESIVSLSQNTDNVTRSALSAVERIEKQASTAGLGAVDKLRIQQQQLISQLGDNEAAILRVNTAYDKLTRTREAATIAAQKERIATQVASVEARASTAGLDAVGLLQAERRRLLSQLNPEDVVARQTIFSSYQKIIAAKVAEEEAAAARAGEGAIFGARRLNFAVRGVKDVAEGRQTFALAEGVNEALSFGSKGIVAGAAVAAIAAIGVALYEASKHAEELAQAPYKIAAAFNEVTRPIQQSSDELALANARLENDIAKLQGKPQNGLALAIHEAAIEAGKLSDALDSVFGKAVKAFEQFRAGVFSFGNLAGTEAATPDIDKEIQRFQREIGSVTLEGNRKVHDIQARAGIDEATKATEIAKANEELRRNVNATLERELVNYVYPEQSRTATFGKARGEGIYAQSGVDVTRRQGELLGFQDLIKTEQYQADERIRNSRDVAEKDRLDKAKANADQLARYQEARASYDQTDQPGAKLIELVAKLNKQFVDFPAAYQRAGLSEGFRGAFSRELQTEQDEVRKQALEREDFYIKGIAESWKQVNGEVERYDKGVVEQAKKLTSIAAEIAKVDEQGERQRVTRESAHQERLEQLRFGPGRQGEAAASAYNRSIGLGEQFEAERVAEIQQRYQGPLTQVQIAERELAIRRDINEVRAIGDNAEFQRQEKILELVRQKEESARRFGEGLFDAARRGGEGLQRFFASQLESIARTVSGNAFAELFKNFSLHSNAAPDSFAGKLLARTPFGPDQLKIAQSKFDESNHLGDLLLEEGAVPVKIVGFTQPEGGSFRAQGISGVERLLGVAPFLANSIGRQADAALSAPISQSTAVSSVFRPVSEGEASPFEDPLAGLPAGERSAAIASTLFGGSIPGISGVGASARLAGRLGAFGNSAILSSISNAVSTDAIVGGSYLGGERSQSIANAVFGGDNGNISFPNIDSQDGSYPRFSAGSLGGALSSISGIVGGPGGTSGFAGPVSGLGGLPGLGGPLSRIGGIFGNHTPPIGTIDDTPAGLGAASFGGQYSGLLGGLGLSLGIGGLFAKQQTPFSSAQSVGGFGLSGASFASHLPLSGSALGGTGALGGALAGIGVGIAADGLRRGGIAGLGEDIGGGALIGEQFGGPIGALIGAGIGAVAGIIRLGVKGKAEQVQEQVKQAYRLDISKAFAQQIADTADKQYGGSISVAIHSKPVMDLLFDYAQATGQNFGIRNQARASTLTQTASGLYQQAIYENGKALSFAGLPVYGGVQTQTILPPQYGPTGTLLPYQQIPGDNYAVPFTSPSTGSTTLLPVSASGSPGSSAPVNVTVHNTISGDDVGDYLDGRTVTTIANNPRAVQQASFDAGQGNYLRRQNFGAGLNPAELLS